MTWPRSWHCIQAHGLEAGAGQEGRQWGDPCGEVGHAVSDDSQDTELSLGPGDPGEAPHWSLASGIGVEADGDQGGGDQDPDQAHGQVPQADRGRGC